MSSPEAPSTPAGRRSVRLGVSLLTILVTLAAVALVAGLAIPLWFSRHDVTLDNAALLLARDLRAAQGRAAILGVPLKVELSEHGWTARFHDGTGVLRAGSDEPLRRALDADGVFEGVSLGLIQFGADSAVEFGPLGEWVESGSVELRFRGEARRLVLTGPHGEIEIVGLGPSRSIDSH